MEASRTKCNSRGIYLHALAPVRDNYKCPHLQTTLLSRVDLTEVVVFWKHANRLQRAALCNLIVMKQ